MPVHVPGPRIYSSIKLKHIGQVIHAHQRASNISLNLTPFVDMMTILVTFLLMVFSASGEILRAHQGLEMPLASQQAKLQQAPIIIVTESTISVLIQSTDSTMPLVKDVAQVETLIDNPPPTMIIDALHELLMAQYQELHENINSAVDSDHPNKFVDKDGIAACKRESEGLPPIAGKPLCPDGLAIVQADKHTDAKIITMIVNSAHLSGFDKLLFAIKYSAEGPQ